MLKHIMIKTALIAFVWSVSIAANAYANDLKQINIPPGDLGTALRELAQQAGVEFFYQSEQVKGLRTQGVTGTLSPQEAVTKLLEGTSLTLKTDSSGAMLIERFVAGDESNGANTPAKEGKTSSSSGFLTAQVDQGASSQSPALGSDSSGSLESSKEGELQEVIVTAQKREQRLIDVPISMVALGAEELRRSQINSLEDLPSVVPDLGVVSRGGTQFVEIRGISNILGGGGSLIGFYVDDADVTLGGKGAVQIDRVTSDLERVEVLRGPQGTLYGDGSAGGTVRLITKDPDLKRFTFDSQVAALFTEDGGPSRRVNAVANVPLVEDQLGIRVDGTFEHNGGWIDEPAASQKNINWQDLTSVRIKGLWRPDPNLTVTPMVIISRDDRSRDISDTASPTIITPAFNLPTVPRVKKNYDLYNLTLTYDFLSTVRALNSTSYLKLSQQSLNQLEHDQLDRPGTEPYDYYSPIEDVESKLLTNEFRLTSIGSGPWQWVSGVFYRRFQELDSNPENYYARPGPPGTPLPTPYGIGTDILYKSWSIFGDASYRLTSRLTVGVGGRYYRQDQDFSSLFSSVKTQTGQFHSTDPRAYGQFKLTSNVNIYASAAKGFRSGGFNTDPSQPTFGPEDIWSYELGTKMSLLNGRVSIDAAVFKSDYANYQSYAYVSPSTGYYFNVSKARIKGIEGDLTWSPSAQWRFDVRADYVNARFVEVDAASAAFAVGDPVDYVPRYQLSASGQHDFLLLGKHGFIRLDYSQQGPMTTINRLIGPWWDNKSDIIHMLNLNTSLFMRDNLRFGVFAQNLLNENGFSSPTGRLLGGDVRPRPRTVGVDFSVTVD